MADDPQLSVAGQLLLLRNRRAPPELLSRMGRDGNWIGQPEIARGLLLHPQTPVSVALELLPYLPWKILAEASVATQVSASVRRQAEKLLAQRLEGLSLGETIALARKASPGLILALCGSADSRVLRALLENARLIEADAVRIASSRHAPAAALARLATHRVWGGRLEVRHALLRNPRTPTEVAFHLSRELPIGDPLLLSRDVKVTRIEG